MELGFYLPTKIRMGEGCIRTHAAECKALGSRALIVTDPDSYRLNGSGKEIMQILEENGISYDLYDGVESNPTIGNVRRGVQACKKFGADFLIATGGGSPMDAAKAISLLAVQETEDSELFTKQYTSQVLPLVCVPTTAGTGSEVTPYAMIINEKDGTKNNLNSPYIFSKIAFLDARYTLTLPIRVTINTSIDALTHSLESIFARTTNPLVQSVAKEGIRNIAACFPALRRGELALAEREKLMMGSLMGGMVVSQTRTTALHGMSYPMTSDGHIPHGRAMALILSNYMFFWNRHEPELIRELLSIMGLSSIEEFGEIIDELVGEIRAEEILSDDTIQAYADEVMQKHNIINTRVPITREDVVRIYCYGR
jgi:alcohol dehydrogenase class IV